MCQLSGISKAGTKENSTRIVDGYLFSRLFSEHSAKSRACGSERGALAFYCDSVLSATASKCFLRGLWNNNARVRMFPQRTVERIPSPRGISV